MDYYNDIIVPILFAVFMIGVVLCTFAFVIHVLSPGYLNEQFDRIEDLKAEAGVEEEQLEPATVVEEKSKQEPVVVEHKQVNVDINADVTSIVKLVIVAIVVIAVAFAGTRIYALRVRKTEVDARILETKVKSLDTVDLDLVNKYISDENEGSQE